MSEQTSQPKPQGVPGRQRDPVEELAREIFIRAVNGTAIRAFTANQLAQQCFDQAEQFVRVADLRRRGAAVTAGTAPSAAPKKE